MTILFSPATSFEGNLARRIFFSDHKTSTIITTTEESLYGQSFSKWLDEFLSRDSDKEKQSDSFSKLALLKKILFSSSSSSSDKNNRLDKLFQILNNSTDDDKNESSSSNKLNRLLGFFDTHGSSTNLQLAMKLLNLAQGNGGLSSLNTTDMKSLIKFVSG
jgi:hypothetical protein